MSSKEIRIEVSVAEDAEPSPRLSAALAELAETLAAEEIVSYVEEPEVDGFGFRGPTFGDLGVAFKPGSMGICVGKTTGGSNDGDDCGSYCYVNSDNDTTACGVDVW